jgi:RNA-binding protein
MDHEPEYSPGGGKLTQVQRRGLLARGHELRATLCVGRGGLTQAVIDDIRHAMTRRDLLKVRIDAASGQEATRIAGELARHVGADLVQRVGRVALLYRALPQKPLSE